MIFDILKPRFILDVFKIASNGQSAIPLNVTELRKFSTRAQADAVMSMLPKGCSNASIVDDTGGFIGDVRTNYRDDSDPANLYPLAVQFDVEVPSKSPDVPPMKGTKTLNIGEMLFSRSLLGSGKDKSVLVLDDIGQVFFK